MRKAKEGDFSISPEARAGGKRRVEKSSVLEKELRDKQVLLNTGTVCMGMWSILYYWRSLKMSYSQLLLYMAGLV